MDEGKGYNIMRALVLSGGGAYGSFQAGVIKELMKKNKYDLICGVSVGALNGSFVSQYSNQVEAGLRLKKMWLSIDNRSVYKKWFFWPLSVLWKSSIYDSTPLKKLIKENISPALIKDVVCSVGVVDHQTGKYSTIVLNDMENEKVHGFIQASSAFPAFLNPFKYKGKTYYDGGLRNITPLTDAINLGGEKIDVVMCQPKGISRMTDRDPKVFGIAKRVIDILMSEIIENDIEIAKLHNRLLRNSCGDDDKRLIDINVYRPLDDLPIKSSLDFDPKKIKQSLAIGEAVAKYGLTS
jgi:NTE family protein